MRAVSLARSKRPLIVMAFGIVAVVFVAGAVLGLTSFIDQKLSQSAEQQAVTFTEQAAENVADHLSMVESSINSFTVQSSDPAAVAPALRALVDYQGFANAAFVDMDGEGLLDDNAPFSVDEVTQPETALSQSRESTSEPYLNSDGVRVQLVQSPLFIDGKQVGALYVQVPLSMFTMPTRLDMFDGRGYFMLFDASSGSVLVPPTGVTKTPFSNGMAVYEFLDKASNSDGPLQGSGGLAAVFSSQAVGIDGLRDTVRSGAVGLASAVVDGEDSYVCVAPVGEGRWYVCSIMPIENVRAEAAVVTVTFQIVFGIVLVCLAAVGLLLFASYRRGVRERNIAMTSQLYEALSDSLDMAVNLYSASDARVTPIVAKATDIIGYSLHDFLEDPALAQTIGLSERGVALFDRIRADKVQGFEENEFSFRCPKTDAVRWVKYALKPLMFDDKMQVLIVLRDVTADKQIQLSMRDAMDAAESANRAKSEFLSRMSHEIRTPMNVIIGMLQIAQANLNDEEKTKANLMKIGAASDHLLSLINDVLDISKIENGKMTLVSEPFLLHDILDHVATVIRPQCEKKSQKFFVSMPASADDVYVGDPVRLKQMLLNLLTNAVKYTPVAGHVRFEVSRSSGSIMGYRRISFVVTDDGIGMSEEFQEHLFEPFTMEGRSNAQGTGLGMSIVKNIVSVMGGSVNVESAVGAGTTFTVVLNLRMALDAERAMFEGKEDPSAEGGDVVSALGGRPGWTGPRTGVARLRLGQEPQAIDRREFEGLRALIAEDNELNAEIACELLSESGLVLDHAKDGKKACALFEASPIGFYDVVLMDVQMPQMNGYDATRCIRALDRTDARAVPIIAMSANAFSDDVNASLASGMDAHLSKPINMKDVLATIAGFVRERREGDAPSPGE